MVQKVLSIRYVLEALLSLVGGECDAREITYHFYGTLSKTRDLERRNSNQFASSQCAAITFVRGVPDPVPTGCTNSSKIAANWVST